MRMEQIALIIVILIFIIGISFQLFKNRKLLAEQYRLSSNSYVLYLFSLLVPLVGIIVGSIKLSKDDNFNRSIGINCIILSIISMIIGAILIFK